jgi:predicted amidophosphoribosyltransferase
MKCPRCQHENRPGAKFREECAAPLARACANCGAQFSATAKFCSECAHPASQPAPSTPRRFNVPESYTPKHLVEKILSSKAALEHLDFQMQGEGPEAFQVLGRVWICGRSQDRRTEPKYRT